MSNINFMPDDYIQKRSSLRYNLIYLFLIFMVIAAMGSTFGIIKMRQKAVKKRANLVAEKLANAQKEIEQLEALQVKRKEMMRTALTAAELIEPISRSLILASLTNNLPQGTRLTKISLIEKKVQTSTRLAGSNQYDNVKNPTVTPKPSTLIEIEGLAPGDKDVAAYIAQLDISEFFNQVSLIYTQENTKEKKNTTPLRRFKLTAMLNNEMHITQGTVDEIAHLQ